MPPRTGETPSVAEVLARVNEAFGEVQRPEIFYRGTCRCEECEEHNETMEAHTPETLSLEQGSNPGWDPICMASDHAFAYFVPALVRLCFADPYYSDQFLFHLNSPGRAEYLNKAQAKALQTAIWLMVAQMEPFPRGPLHVDSADEALRRMERIVAGEPPSEHS
ncbi:MAG: hypothetical protein ABI823_04785 [Bryobacteraceae bacterium]